MSKDTELAAETAAEGKENLKLWRMVEKTPPDMTKPVGYGKRNYTTIDPQWQLLKATGLWGPYGHRWGLRNLKYEIREVTTNDKVALETRDSENKLVKSVEQLSTFTNHSIILEAEFFYPAPGGGTASFPMINDDKYKVDDDVLKKLITNTRSKALSLLGFSADVFLGKFEDTRYVEDSRKRFARQNAFAAKAATTIWEASSLEELSDCEQRLNGVIAKQGKDLDKDAVDELRALISERRQELKGKGE